jgi:hypothetical protein
MPDMTITQTVTEEDFRKAYGRYYYTNLLTRFRPWLGVALIASAVYLWVRSPEQATVAAVLVLFGCYLLLAKWTYIARRLREGRRAGRLPSDMEVELSRDGTMKVSAGGGSSDLDLRKMYGYQVAEFGVLVYLRRSAFFLLKRDAIEQAGGLDGLVSIFAGSGLKRMK